MSVNPVNSGKLPKKEAEMFKLLVTCYEQKEYKKGLKTADTILKKYQNHGETLAMKGLVLNCTGKKEEALELVKLGLRNDVKSHICWHVYGLVHRSDFNYKEAIKCYLNALRIDPSNQNILRDLSYLQVHMRDFEGFMNSRARILENRPTYRVHWVACAVAFYLGEQYERAFDIIARYGQSGINEQVGQYEESELVLFQNKCLEMRGKHIDAIAHLEQHSNVIVDKFSARIKLAELATLSGRFDAARQQWENLVISQTENYRFHAGWQTSALELDGKTSKEMLSLKQLELPSTKLVLNEDKLNRLRTLYSDPRLQKSRAVKKIELTIVKDSELRSLLDKHCRHQLRDAVPSLINDVCSLVVSADPYNPTVTGFVSDPFDFREHPISVMAKDLVDGFINSLRSCGYFSPQPEEASQREGDGDREGGNNGKEIPTALLWALFLKAHLLEMSGDIQGALVVIEECIAHTPTALDMHVKKARLVKKAGDIEQASRIADGVRELDLQDRYLNNKATKYLLRANKVPEAIDTIAMFTKHDIEGDPQKTLFEMQCAWFEIELAEAYSRLKNWGMALKKFNAIRKHFSDYVEDMFDFHHYSCRKTTLRMYTEVLTMQDKIFAHKTFQRAVRGALEIYLHLIDSPEDIDGLGHLPTAERKKERAKLKKRKAKVEAKEREAADEAKLSGPDVAQKRVAEDGDPLGEKLLQKNFLLEAQSWCTLITSKMALCAPETLSLAAEVLLRSGKLLLVTRAVCSGLKSHPNSPDLTVMLIKLARRIRGLDGAVAASVTAMKPIVVAAIKAEVDTHLGGPNADLATFCVKYVDVAKELKSLPHLIGAGRCVILTSGSKAPAVAAARQKAMDLLAHISSSDENPIFIGRGINVQSLELARKYVTTELKLDGDWVTKRARNTFPVAVSFMDVSESVPADVGQAEL